MAWLASWRYVSAAASLFFEFHPRRAVSAAFQHPSCAGLSAFRGPWPYGAQWQFKGAGFRWLIVQASGLGRGQTRRSERFSGVEFRQDDAGEHGEVREC